MRSLPWGSITVFYMVGLLATFVQAAPEVFDACSQVSYCASRVMENAAWSLVWPAYWLMG